MRRPGRSRREGCGARRNSVSAAGGSWWARAGGRSPRPRSLAPGGPWPRSSTPAALSPRPGGPRPARRRPRCRSCSGLGPTGPAPRLPWSSPGRRPSPGTRTRCLGPCGAPLRASTSRPIGRSRPSRPAGRCPAPRSSAPVRTASPRPWGSSAAAQRGRHHDRDHHHVSLGHRSRPPAPARGTSCPRSSGFPALERLAGDLLPPAACVDLDLGLHAVQAHRAALESASSKTFVGHGEPVVDVLDVGSSYLDDDRVQGPFRELGVACSTCQCAEEDVPVSGRKFLLEDPPGGASGPDDLLEGPREIPFLREWGAVENRRDGLSDRRNRRGRATGWTRIAPWWPPWLRRGR
jgi:hypothetical protein